MELWIAWLWFAGPASDVSGQVEFEERSCSDLSFDCPCSEEAKSANLTIVCVVPPGFDRVAFHRKFNEEVAAR